MINITFFLTRSSKESWSDCVKRYKNDLFYSYSLEECEVPERIPGLLKDLDKLAKLADFYFSLYSDDLYKKAVEDMANIYASIWDIVYEGLTDEELYQ